MNGDKTSGEKKVSDARAAIVAGVALVIAAFYVFFGIDGTTTVTWSYATASFRSIRIHGATGQTIPVPALRRPLHCPETSYRRT